MPISESTQRALLIALGSNDAANDLIRGIDGPSGAGRGRDLPPLPEKFKNLAAVRDYLAALDAALRGT